MGVISNLFITLRQYILDGKTDEEILAEFPNIQAYIKVELKFLRQNLNKEGELNVSHDHSSRKSG